MEIGNSTGETERKIDLVFCIDGTGSMYNLIDDVKRNAKKFREVLVEEMIKAKTSITSLRVKVITFRDYCNAEDAMEISRFFELPDEQEEFEKTVDAIKAQNGGDNPENGLEALYYATQSDFYTGNKDRQIIVLFTDDDALEFKARAKYDGYPGDMVDMKGFQDIWACASQGDSKLRDNLKRMILFAPKGTIYEKQIAPMHRVNYIPVNREDGLKEIDFSVIIKEIIRSATAR